MVDLATSFAAGFLATFIPVYLGLFAPQVLVKVWKNQKIPTLLAAASAGIMFWFFLDVMGDAALLDVNQGFDRWNVTQTLLVILFPASLGILYGLERRFSRTAPTQSQSTIAEAGRDSPDPMGITYVIAAVAALGIGFHALGEGLAIGVNIPASPTIIDAIGSVSAGVAYVLHKFLEGFVIGVFALLATSTSFRKLGVLGIIAGVPTIIGFFLGVVGPAPPEPFNPNTFNPLAATFYFALGGAAVLYIESKLIPLFTRNRLEYVSVIPLLLGFYAMYIAGLFHS